MLIIEMKILTRNGLWKVVTGKYGLYPVQYYVKDKHFSGWNPVPNDLVPKTVLNKARCFIANPKLFGKERYI